MAEYQTRHAVTNAALNDLLCLLEVLLPDTHHMPSSAYMLRKAVRRPLVASSVPSVTGLDRKRLVTAHMCGSDKCDHIYSNYPGEDDEVCPRAHCRARRFKCAPCLRAGAPDGTLLLHCTTAKQFYRPLHADALQTARLGRRGWCGTLGSPMGSRCCSFGQSGAVPRRATT